VRTLAFRWAKTSSLPPTTTTPICSQTYSQIWCHSEISCTKYFAAPGTVLQTALCYLEALQAIRLKVPELAKQEQCGEGARGEVELGSRIVKEEDAEETCTRPASQHLWSSGTNAPLSSPSSHLWRRPFPSRRCIVHLRHERRQRGTSPLACNPSMRSPRRYLG